MNAKSSFIVASAIAVVLTSARVMAQIEVGGYGYKFVPNDPNSQWGGEIWFGIPADANGIDGINNETEFYESYITTPDGSFVLDTQGSLQPPPVQPTLPQSPFPYTSSVGLSRYEQGLDYDYGPLSATWNPSAITSMFIAGGGYEQWNGNYNGGQFETPGVYGVFEQNIWIITQDSISETNGFAPLSQGGLDPSDGGTVMGQWVPIPDRTNTFPLFGLTALALFGASRRLGLCEAPYRNHFVQNQ